MSTGGWGTGGWGTGGWGTGGWGGGSFVSPTTEVIVNSVVYVTPTLIKLELDKDVVVESANYLNPDNYNVAPRTVTITSNGNSNTLPMPLPIHFGPGGEVLTQGIQGIGIQIIRVIPPTQDIVVVNYVWLETTLHTNGAVYDLSFSKLIVTDGVTGLQNSIASYQARVTKTMIALKSIPSHFDKRPSSLTFNLMAAISLQDDLIGGSRKDDL